MCECEGDFIIACIEECLQCDGLVQELRKRAEKEERESSRLAHELSLKTEVSSPYLSSIEMDLNMTGIRWLNYVMCGIMVELVMIYSMCGLLDTNGRSSSDGGRS